ncbi:MAG TPA: hypothetical protein VNJ07_04555 [Chitinophagales bacterium]|nr:hypothetical protein [Chitinophagales bacterium]
MLLCPPFAMLMAYTGTQLHGSFAGLLSFLKEEGFLKGVWHIWSPVFFGTKSAWLIIGTFALTQLLFIKLLRGPRNEGPETATGFIPVYKANGRASFFLTVALYWLFSFKLKWFSPAILYDHFVEIIGALNFTVLVFCLVLYFKGRFFPSSNDTVVTGNFIYDYWRGTELYPSVCGWNVKHFTNSRFGMMAWLLIIISFAAKQDELHGITDGMFISLALQVWYISQFFWWETGYFRTMDIQHDRAGFIIIWGTMVWVPAIYTSPSLYLVHHPLTLGWVPAGIIFIIGAFSILAKNLSNRQRLRVRETNGNTAVWGKPPRIIRAKYVNSKGEQKENILLASGYWGVARHFHYAGEILGALCWSIPALFSGFYPYFYVTYLTILLVHRVNRDDRKCSLKYGIYWDEYRKLVPWKILPGVY